MTKEEAEKEVARLNNINPDWFCPLLQTLCNPVCVCFVKARVRELRQETDPAKKYYTANAGCNNAMFFNQCGCN